MARNPTDRVELLNELTALVRRVELRIGDRNVVFGFRSNGSASMYFGQDFVVGFNATHEVRRVFLHGRLFRAEPGRNVVQLVPERNDRQTVLHTNQLTKEEQDELQAVIRWHVEMLCRALAGDRYQVLACVPDDLEDAILRDVRAELHAILDRGPTFADGMSP